MIPDTPLADPALRGDCARCAGLCCVAPAFAASADFAVTKPAGQPCGNLTTDLRCGIHPELRERGFAGCTVFDCFGAGQQVTQVTFGGADWRTDPRLAGVMFDVFGVMRHLQELRWYVAQALNWPRAQALHAELDGAREQLEQLVAGDPDELLGVDLGALREKFGGLLQRVSERVRSGVPRRGTDRPGADLIGADLRRVRLRGASLRGAYLIAADLRAADLTDTDLLGTDLRAADLRGTDVSTTLFLTQPQLDAARGNARTTIPDSLTRPTHWPAGELTRSRAAAG